MAHPIGRLVVVSGPDVGLSLPIPDTGGGIGRGEINPIQLSDLAVSRTHCAIEIRDGSVVLCDAGARNKTQVNGQPITVHPLEDGDEITIGKTRLVFVPERGGKAVARAPVPSRVTMEIGSGELLNLGRGPGQGLGKHGRARRHLANLAALGDTLRRARDRRAAQKAAAIAARATLNADCARIFEAAQGHLTIVAQSDPGAPAAVPEALIGKVLGEGKAVAMESDLSGVRKNLIAAPLVTATLAGPDRMAGIVYVERAGTAQWDDIDLTALGCLTQLLSASLAQIDQTAALAMENQELKNQLGSGDLIGTSPAQEKTLSFIGKVAPTDATVLITGESGSGKEMVARSIHRASRRSEHPLIAVNCAALTETLLESELFGHEKGAFTGATERVAGRFELADGGTLFLDEIGELSAGCQSKFLRVLEERAFVRVGGTRPVTVDVRVIAATNRDLAAMVARGAFREDLFYRISVIQHEVPPLRQRAADIPALATAFLERLRSQVARRVAGFSAEAMAALCAHSWPGNVRELKNAVERAVVLGDGEVIRAEDLPPPIAASEGIPMATMRIPTAPCADAPLLPAIGTRARSIKELEREGILCALAETGGNKAQAAAILEIDRSTLYKKIKEYEIG
ncbi:MAG TPA: sigma 54-interacting transcriptional regulator [Kofleriaceae bacterium]|nr:sigma 54-interacting transcriptional regulator [Kofleriaceae bacterium]